MTSLPLAKGDNLVIEYGLRGPLGSASVVSSNEVRCAGSTMVSSPSPCCGGGLN